MAMFRAFLRDAFINFLAGYDTAFRKFHIRFLARLWSTQVS
jgi:hypothetical protein